MSALVLFKKGLRNLVRHALMHSLLPLYGSHSFCFFVKVLEAWHCFFVLLMAPQLSPPPPRGRPVKATQINTIPTPTVAWTRPLTPRFKKRRFHGEMVQERVV